MTRPWGGPGGAPGGPRGGVCEAVGSRLGGSGGPPGGSPPGGSPSPPETPPRPPPLPTGAPPGAPPGPPQGLVCLWGTFYRGPMTGRPRGPPRGGPPGPASRPRPPIGGAPPRGDEGNLIMVKHVNPTKNRGETWCDRPQKRGKNTHKGLKLGPFWAPLQGAHFVCFWGGPRAEFFYVCYTGVMLILRGASGYPRGRGTRTPQDARCAHESPPRGPPGAPPGPPQGRFLCVFAFFFIFSRGLWSGRPGGPPRGGPPGPASGPRPPIGGAPPRGDEGKLGVIDEENQLKNPRRAMVRSTANEG
jgi:hypothetical protein